MPKLIEYKDMAPRAKAVVEGIALARGTDPSDINNVWKALARHPAVMEQFAAEMKAAFAPGKLDPLTKELLNLAVSIANQCEYSVVRPAGISWTDHAFDRGGSYNAFPIKSNRRAVPLDRNPRYCIASHGAMARKKGMTEEMHEEFMRVVLGAQKGNKIAMAYRVPIDAAFEEK